MNELVLTLVNGEPWDAHKPLSNDCDLEILSATHNDFDKLALVNKTLWRSFSLMLGAVIENAFKEQYNINLHSFPPPNGR